MMRKYRQNATISHALTCVALIIIYLALYEKISYNIVFLQNTRIYYSFIHPLATFLPMFLKNFRKMVAIFFKMLYNA